MGFRTIVVNSHCKLSYKNNHLVYRSETGAEMIHLSEIDLLICETTDIALTTMLISKLMDASVLVIFCDEKRLPKAQLLPFYGRHDCALSLKRQLNWDNDRKADVWTSIIYQKINNQEKFLIHNDFILKAKRISKLKSELKTLDPSNREGHVARIYFNQLFGNDFSRDRPCDINAGLDYGYTLLMSSFAREIVKNGCLTQIGLKHDNQFNEFNFASDLMEPFRTLVDEIVYHNRNENFQTIKRQLYNLFTDCYTYKGDKMYLTNIIGDYVKRTIDALNNKKKEVPIF